MCLKLVSKSWVVDDFEAEPMHREAQKTKGPELLGPHPFVYPTWGRVKWNNLHKNKF